MLSALVHTTVYAGVRATSTGERLAEGTGLRAESGAELAVLLLEAPDGRRALPVFSTVDALRRWRVEARPHRLTGAQACLAAAEEGAGQLVLDPAGAALVLEPAEVTALGRGWVPVPGSGLAVTALDTALGEPEGAPEPLLRALRQALAPEDLRAARLLAGPEGLVLGVAPRRPLDPGALAALAQRLVDRLGADLPADGLDLTQVAPRGPGLPVVGAQRRTGLWRRGAGRAGC